MDIKKICLNIIAYILTAALLFYSGWFEFKHGNKTVGVLTFVMALFVIWNAYENYKDMTSSSGVNLDNRNILGPLKI